MERNQRTTNRPSKASRKKKRRAHRRAVAVLLAVLAVVVVLLFLLYTLISDKLNRLSREDGVNYTSSFDASLLGDDPALAQRLAGIDVTENGGDITPPEGDVNPAPDGVYNILLIGTDEREAEYERSRADSILMLSINTKTNSLRLMSFERGLGVSVPNHGDDWLTHTFAYGGADLLLSTIRSYFKVDVSHYVRVNFTVFETAITDIGGVDVDMTAAEAEYMNGIAGETRWQEGVSRLDGPTALVYARIRHLDDDWMRVGRQRKVIQGCIDQAKNLSWDKINLLADKLLPMVETNLSNMEIMRLMVAVPRFAGIQAKQMTAPVNVWGSALANGRVVISCDFDENAEVIDNFLYGDGSLLAAVTESDNSK